MSLLGIDVGTTACKAAAFSEEGRLIAGAHAEYDIQRRRTGWAELDSFMVWDSVKRTICRVTSNCEKDPVTALAVSSLSEATVPVTLEREILGPSILNFDVRGEEFLESLRPILGDELLYQINGNSLANHYGLTKLLWIKQHQTGLYDRADKFLLWAGFVSFMLGAEPIVDYSLANRTLLFDIDRARWSNKILDLACIDERKLPSTGPSGTIIGKVSDRIAAEVGLAPGVVIVNGAHDQCANAVGCGAIVEGQAAFGMGTFLCITPVFGNRPNPRTMLNHGLSTEHHAVPGKFVTFIYNQGGSCVKWFRDTFAATERMEAEKAGIDVYDKLFSEVLHEPSRVLFLPQFATTGLLAGLQLDTLRGEILKGIIEGTTFDLKETVESLSLAGVAIPDCRAVGGGSKSDAWIQTCADILGRPFVRPEVTEAGALGAAIIAGVGSGVFPSFETGVEAMVRLGHRFHPDERIASLYEERFQEYKHLRAQFEM